MKTISQCEPLIGKAEREAVNRYMESGGFIVEYQETEKLEKMLAEYLDVPFVSMVPNGTIALYLCLMATELTMIDEVLVPDYTMIATPNAVVMAHKRLKLADIYPSSLCLDMKSVDSFYRIKAAIYVDINGRGGDLEAVVKFCKRQGIVLIEDACQAFGSKLNGKHLGTFGRFGCFSLSFHKIITAGQGGFIVTHNQRDYNTIERLKDYGRLSGGGDHHPYMGFNFKYTDLQSVIAIEQLKTIEKRIAKKRKIYEWYVGEKPSKDYVPWFIEYKTDHRKRLVDRLTEKGIGSRPFYPPIHSQPIYKDYPKFPIAELVSRKGLWLPSALTLTKKDVDYIKEVLDEKL
jgi:perosamine synthetase